MACMYALLEHRRVVAPHQPVPRFDVDLSRKNYPPVALLLCKYPLPFFYLLLFFSPVLPRLPYFFFFFFFFFVHFKRYQTLSLSGRSFGNVLLSRINLYVPSRGFHRPEGDQMKKERAGYREKGRRAE